LKASGRFTPPTHHLSKDRLHAHRGVMVKGLVFSDTQQLFINMFVEYAPKYALGNTASFSQAGKEGEGAQKPAKLVSSTRFAVHQNV
jgi:hypothetical protein